MNKFHLFHKWTEKRKMMSVQYSGLLAPVGECDAIGVVRTCSICGKKDAYIISMDNRMQDVQPEFIEGITNE